MVFVINSNILLLNNIIKMLFKNNLVLLLLLINISYSFSFETDFKLKPIVGNGFNEDFDLNAKYGTIDDVIKDVRILVNTFMVHYGVH